MGNRCTNNPNWRHTDMLILEILVAWFVVSVPAALLCGAALYRTSSEALTNTVPWEPAMRSGRQPVHSAA